MQERRREILSKPLGKCIRKHSTKRKRRPSIEQSRQLPLRKLRVPGDPSGAKFLQKVRAPFAQTQPTWLVHFSRRGNEGGIFARRGVEQLFPRIDGGEEGSSEYLIHLRGLQTALTAGVLVSKAFMRRERNDYASATRTRVRSMHPAPRHKRKVSWASMRPGKGVKAETSRDTG